VEDATEDYVGGDTEEDRERKEPVYDQGNVRGQEVYWSSPGFLENDEGGGEDGATRPGGGEGEGRRAASLVTLSFCHSLLSLSPVSLLFPTGLSLFHCLSLFLSIWDRPGGGRGSRREPLADWSRAQRTANGKGLYIISS